MRSADRMYSSRPAKNLQEGGDLRVEARAPAAVAALDSPRGDLPPPPLISIKNYLDRFASGEVGRGTASKKKASRGCSPKLSAASYADFGGQSMAVRAQHMPGAPR
jgi:hypothetical protein